MEKETKIKKKVFIFAGNERPALQNTYHNIGWSIADELTQELELTWERIGNALVAEKDNLMYVKPVAKNPMDIDKETLGESWEKLGLDHGPDYYGYTDTYFDGYGYGDYNSSGIAVLELFQQKIISKNDDCYIISDNDKIKTGKVEILADGRYFADEQNNAIKDILMRNDMPFKRIDIGTIRDKHHEKIDPKKIDIAKISKEILEVVTKEEIMLDKISNLGSIASAVDLNKAIKFLQHTQNKGVHFLTLLNKNTDKIAKLPENQTSGVKFNLVKLVYFMTDNYPDVLRPMMKQQEFVEILHKLDLYCANFGNKRHFNTFLPPSRYLEEQLSTKRTKVLTPYFDQTFSSPVTGIRSYAADLVDLKSLGVDIFDSQHYQSKETLSSLMLKIDELVEASDSCFFMPNPFNIRDEFKPCNGFKKAIDLRSCTNDVRRTFWETYILNKAIEYTKGVSGICGGLQMMANAMGFYVGELSYPQNHKDMKEKDQVSSPKLQRTVPVLSAHGQGVTLHANRYGKSDQKFYGEKLEDTVQHNSALLAKYELIGATNPHESYDAVVKDLRLTHGKNERNMLSTQYHPEAQQISDVRNQEIMLEMVHEPALLHEHPKIAITVRDNVAKMLDCVKLGTDEKQLLDCVRVGKDEKKSIYQKAEQRRVPLYAGIGYCSY